MIEAAVLERDHDERPGGRLPILLVTSTLDGIGPGRVMADLAVALRPHGFEATLVSTHGQRSSELIDDAEGRGVEVRHLNMRSLWDPRGPRRLVALALEKNARIIHTRTVRADVIARAAARHGVIVINNIVNLYPDDSLTWHGPVKGRIVLALAKATQRPVAAFVPNAHALQASVRDVFNVSPDRIRVIHDGIPLDRWRNPEPADLSQWGVEAGHKVCFTAARLHAQKGLFDLIAAAERVASTHPEARFLIAGDGPLHSELAAAIARAGLTERVHLLGWREDVPRLLAASHLFVLPSHFEGLPNAVIEAMAVGRPVVATAVAGTPEIVQEGITGWLVPPSRPEVLATKIEAALGADLARMGVAARARAEEIFSVERMSAEFAALYSQLLSDR